MWNRTKLKLKKNKYIKEKERKEQVCSVDFHWIINSVKKMALNLVGTSNILPTLCHDVVLFFFFKSCNKSQMFYRSTSIKIYHLLNSEFITFSLFIFVCDQTNLI